MKALRCKELGPADKLVLEDVPPPEPADNQVLIDVQAAGINFPDTLIIEGKYQIKPELPFTPGGEVAGIITKLGGEVSEFTVGDRVVAMTGTGGFAQQVAVAAVGVMRMPDAMSFAVGSGFCMTYGTSYYALKQRAALQPGETLLVLGAAGGVGLAAVEIGKSMGARVIAAASSEEKLAVARAAGADLSINYTTDSLKDCAKALTDGRGVDVVYDPIGGDFAEQALRATGFDGRYLVIGFAAGSIPRIPLNLTLLKNNAIVGVFWGEWKRREPAASQQNYQELFALCEAGKLDPKVTQIFRPENYVDAFATLTGRRALGKVVFDFS